MRTCPKCKLTKDESEFNRDKSKKGGLSIYCKQCRRLQRKLYVEANHEQVVERQRQYNARHKEERKQYYENTRSARIAYGREYRKKNMPVILERLREYGEKYPERILAAKAVREAIKQKAIKPARKQKCADCGKKAQHLHHESYEPDQWINVVPLCRSCHKKRHMSSKV